MADTAVKSEAIGIQTKVQKFGAFLSSMVMPNIGAFIAWGIITALFIPTGWIPNESLNQLVGPSIRYLLPLLVGVMGGSLIYGRRGSVMAAIVVMGVILGADVPMFMGAMIMGPVSAWVIKRIDQWFAGKIKVGFEMLIDNFTLGIAGAVMMILAYWAIGPAVAALNGWIFTGVNFIMQAGALPLSSIFVVPAQVLFLNNAVNHGILVPMGIQQAAEAGRSLLFLVEANNGPMAGVLMAYWLYGKGVSKATAPGSLVIVLFGGIGEVYFPYVLRKPKLIIAPILGSMSALTAWSIFGTGLVAAPSPGSIFAVLSMTPKGHFTSILIGYAIGILVAFLVASLMLKRDTAEEADNGDLAASVKQMELLKGKESKAAAALKEQVDLTEVKSIIFACDAGMGSSAMGASLLKAKLKKAGIDIEVLHTAINEIPRDAKLIITHKDLAARAKTINRAATYVLIENYLDSPEYEKLIIQLKNRN